MSRLEYAQAKFQPGPCVWAASATCACAHTARGTTWRALFSSSPARSWLLLIAAATTTRSAGRLAQASHTCWDEMRNHLATRRIPHDARMAQKSAMRRAMLVSGPYPFQPSGSSSISLLLRVVGWCLLCVAHSSVRSRKKKNEVSEVWTSSSTCCATSSSSMLQNMDSVAFFIQRPRTQELQLGFGFGLNIPASHQ